jgi:PAS domain S-box-containing protein
LSDPLSLTEEQRIRLLVSAITDYAIYLLDPQGMVASWNPGAERFKGYRADEIIGQHYSRFFTPEDVDADLPNRALRSAERDGRYEAEGWRLRKDGKRFWVHAVIDPIRGGDGELIGFAKITRDITDKKLAQDELESTREALSQSQKLQALGELTGGIAHDFNNLMTVIAGASDFLRKHRDLPEEKKLRYLDSIIETAARATDLTNHLLAFGRRQPIEPIVVELSARLDAFVEMIGRTLGSRIRLELDLKSRDARVEVDPTQLETALLNAAVNARDAMPSGGTLTLSTSDSKLENRPAVCIGIRDTGTGIQPDVMSRVFEPFFTTKEVGKGTGLGLATCYGIVKQNRGSIWVDSEPRVGTTFRIYLPRADVAATQPAEAADAPAVLKGEGHETVLLVEDEALVRNLAADALRRHGYQVLSASTGLEALDLAGQVLHPIDVLVTDVVMPQMGGEQLARRLLTERPTLKVLFISGYSDLGVLQHGALLAGTALLQKPFTPGQLVARVRPVLAADPGPSQARLPLTTH